MEKEVKKWSSNTRVSPLEQANRTKPERRLVSFAAEMMVPANKATEEDKSLPAETQKHKYEEAKSLRTNVLKEADLNRGLEFYKTYKNRVNESGLEHLSFDDLLVLANEASIAFARQVSKEVVLPVGVEAATLKVPSDHAFRDDKWFKKKYVRRKRVKKSLESIGLVSETCNLVKKLCTHKSSSFINVDTAHREQQGYGEIQSKFEQGQCSKTQNGDEIDATEAAVFRTYPKKKRSKRKRKPKNSSERGEGKEQACCDQIYTCDNFFGEEAETEEEKRNACDARNSSNCNPWNGFSFNVQWNNKKKRGSTKLKEKQSNLMILLVAVEAITQQLRLLDISM